jgi:hypothetical protein
MPIRRLLAGSELGANEIEILTKAFDQAMRSLSLVDRNDPLTELLARNIIEVGATDVHNPAEIANEAIKKLGIPPPPK